MTKEITTSIYVEGGEVLSKSTYVTYNPLGEQINSTVFSCTLTDKNLNERKITEEQYQYLVDKYYVDDKIEHTITNTVTHLKRY